MLRATPPGEDGMSKAIRNGDLYADAARVPFAKEAPEGNEAQDGPDYLNLLSRALSQGQTYLDQNVSKKWDRTIRAFRNEHFAGSKYLHRDYKLRSGIFRPRTRAAVRKDLAAAAASLFSTTDAISCEPSDDSNVQQRASAAIVKELLNYRTDRTGGRAAIPWFRVAMGARQDAVLQAVCVSKQSWKIERKTRTEMQPAFSTDPLTGQPKLDPITGQPMPMLDEMGEPIMDEVAFTETVIDRPDIQLIPVENVIADPAADWLDPVQSSAYFIVKYPMRKFEIELKQKNPMQPWKKVDWALLRGSDRDKAQAASVRMTRDGGQDRMDQTATGTGDFEVFWVYEVFMRVNDDDVHFWSAGDRQFLTDPTPVDEIYPAHGGERPYTWGVASLEAHRLHPMAPAESWQPMQQEINDLANLRLDQVKLNVSPIAFVTRGRNVDLGALQRRGPNAVILRTAPDDIEWDRPPDVPTSAYAEMERLNADFDDLAGQFNSSSVQTNRSMNETVGGMKLIAGNANIVGEFDLRTWIETWVEPTLAQVVKLLQYYESDQTVLALCGERAKLFQKFGVNQITDDLLQSQVTVRVNVGIGNGSPQERLQKFAGALTVLTPIYAQHPKVQSGEIEVDLEEVTQEVFGLTGYRDGGKRFVKKGKPRQNPMAEVAVQDAKAKITKTLSEAAKNKAVADKTRQDMKIETAEAVHGAMMDRAQLVHKARTEREGAMDHRREAEANRQHQKQEADAGREYQREESEANRETRRQEFAGSQEGAPAPETEESVEGEQEGGALVQQLVQMLQTPRAREIEFVRDPVSGRLKGARIIDKAKET